MAWLSVRGWRHFQHYDPAKRNVLWIKNYTELLSSDAYLELTGHQRAVLHGLWLEYASSGCQLRLATASLSSRLQLRVTMKTIEVLNHAGFIDIVASKLLADGYQVASPEKSRGREEKEQEQEPLPNPDPDLDQPNGHNDFTDPDFSAIVNAPVLKDISTW